MKKKILALILFSLVIFTVGCKSKHPDKEIEILTPRNKKELDELGSVKNTKNFKDTNIIKENNEIQLIVDEYELLEVKLKDLITIDLLETDHIYIVRIPLEVKNLLNKEMELDSMEIQLVANTGEKITSNLIFPDMSLSFSPNESKTTFIGGEFKAENGKLESLDINYENISLSLEF